MVRASVRAERWWLVPLGPLEGPFRCGSVAAVKALGAGPGGEEGETAEALVGREVWDERRMKKRLDLTRGKERT